MQVGSWPSGDTVGVWLWASCGLTPPSSLWALSSFPRWWFGFSLQPQTSFPSLSQPQPAPGCGDNRYCTDLSCPQQPCTRKWGSSHGPRPQPALPVWNPGRQMARVCRDAFGAQTKMTSNRMGWW